MDSDVRRQSRRRLVVLGFLAIALLVCAGVYALRPNPYGAGNNAASSKPPLVNGDLLKAWIPASSYAYTLARFDDYLNQNHLRATALAIQGDVGVQQNGYAFTLSIQPQNRTLPILVTVTNTNSIISTAVTINGTVQAPATQPVAHPQYSGIGALNAAGLTASQISNLEYSFQQFAPSVSSFTVVPTSLAKRVDPRTDLPYYTFTLQADGKAYAARVDSYDPSTIELIVTDPQTNQAIFDSGVVNNAG